MLFTFGAVCVAQTRNQAGCSDLKWNYRHSDELSWKQSISRNKRISASERARLSKAISQAVDDESVPPEKLKTVVDESRIKYLDLNGDKQPEVIVQAGSDDYCSPTGNCSFWVFRRAGDEYELLLAARATQTYTVQPSSSHGLHDLILTQHGSAFESGGFEYRFDGNTYHLHRSFTVRWSSLPDQGEPQPLKEPLFTDCATVKAEVR